MTTRRSFLSSILAAGMAPAAVGSGILMPVKKIIAPQLINVYDYKPEINFENWLELCPAHPDDKLVFAEFIFYLPPLIATEVRGLGVPVKAEGTPLLRGEIGELSVLPATPARRQVAGTLKKELKLWRPRR